MTPRMDLDPVGSNVWRGMEPLNTYKTVGFHAELNWVQ